MGLLSKIVVGKNLIDQNDAKALIQADRKALVLDVRTAMEYRTEHLTPSINVDVRDKKFSNYLKNYEKDKHYIIYCRSGSRSVKAYRKMKGMGFENIYVLKGGINDWEGSRKLK